MKILKLATGALATAAAVAVAQHSKELVVEADKRIRESVKTVREGYRQRRLERVRK